MANPSYVFSHCDTHDRYKSESAGALVDPSLSHTAGADVNVRDKFGSTPLHTACRLDDGPLVGLLLKGRADHTVVNKQGYTPLDYALRTNNKAIIHALRHADTKVASQSRAATGRLGEHVQHTAE